MGKRHRAYTAFIFHNGRIAPPTEEQAKSCSGPEPGTFPSQVMSTPGSHIEQAASRRALQELNARVGPLADVYSFVYFAPQGNNAENEFCRVLVGDFDGKVTPNRDEMMDIKWARLPDVQADVKDHPDSYTPWFKLSFEGFLKNPLSNEYA